MRFHCLDCEEIDQCIDCFKSAAPVAAGHAASGRHDTSKHVIQVIDPDTDEVVSDPEEILTLANDPAVDSTISNDTSIILIIRKFDRVTLVFKGN